MKGSAGHGSSPRADGSLGPKSVTTSSPESGKRRRLGASVGGGASSYRDLRWFAWPGFMQAYLCEGLESGLDSDGWGGKLTCRGFGHGLIQQDPEVAVFTS